MQSATLPDGRTVFCVNAYEVDFSVHEIFSEDLTTRGLSLPSHGTVLDVGANIGLYSLYLRDRCPDARVIGFEPMPAAFEALERNMAAMNPPGQAVKLALGAQAGWAEFDYFPGIAALSTQNHAVGEALSAGLRRLLGGDRASVEVRDILDKTGASEASRDKDFLDELFRAQTVRAPIDTLSAQMAALGVETVDLLKIDTEGSEGDVLAGLEDEDWPKIRQMVVEVHLGADMTEAMAADLNRRGFRTAIGSHPLSQGGVEVFHIYAAR